MFGCSLVVVDAADWSVLSGGSGAGGVLQAQSTFVLRLLELVSMILEPYLDLQRTETQSGRQLVAL